MSGTGFSDPLLKWYAQNARDLPWRGNPDPYAVWISEIMLQQTRVETVIPYFHRWMERFPTIAELACASQQDVLANWEGLGYYSRARNLHRAAQRVMDDWGGTLPRDVKSLARLPGIGRYTAGAIASIAFSENVATLDGNISRVLARLYDVTEPARSSAGKRRLWELATTNLPPGKAGDYNQALMDLGATLCIPRSPDCINCPLNQFCQAYAKGIQDERPVKEQASKSPHYLVTAAVIQHEQRFLIAQRPENGLLGGLWEFPGGKLQPGEDLVSCLQREICEELDVGIDILGRVGVYRHAYTHFRVTLHAYLCKLHNGAEPRPVQVQALRWVGIPELADFPMGKIDRQIARTLSTLEAAC